MILSHKSNEILFIAPFCNPSSRKWYSPGRNQKINRVIKCLQIAKYKVVRCNSIPVSNDSNKEIRLASAEKSFLRMFQIIFNALSFRFRFKQRPSILWVYNARFPEALAFICLKILFPHAFMVLEIEDCPLARKNNRSLQGLFDLISAYVCSRISHKIFAVSMSVSKSYSNMVGCNINKFSMLPPILDSEFLEVTFNRKKLFAEPLVSCLYAGGYGYEKGINQLLNAFTQISDKNYVLYLTGPAPLWVKKFCQRFSNIELLGLVPNAELYRLYSSCDVAINPHLAIPGSACIFPFKNIEILASGCVPLLSEHSFFGESSLLDRFPKQCIFKGENELSLKIQSTRNLFESFSADLESLSDFIRDEYSERKYSTLFSSQLP